MSLNRKVGKRWKQTTLKKEKESKNTVGGIKCTRGFFIINNVNHFSMSTAIRPNRIG